MSEDYLDFNEPVPKIRVLWSDGTACAIWDQRSKEGDRYWRAPPAADCTESLYVSRTGLFLRCFHSNHPRLSGSAECSDLFDSNSYAVRYTLEEAVAWLQRHGYSVPDDLSGGGVDPAVEAGRVEDAETKKPRSKNGGKPKKRGRGKDPAISKRNDEWLNKWEEGVKNGTFNFKTDFARSLGDDYEYDCVRHGIKEAKERRKSP